MSRLRQTLKLFGQAGRAWLDDDAPSMGAALAFYSAFSLAPLLIIASAVAGLVFGQGAAREAVVSQFHELIGPIGAEAVQRLLNATANIGTGLFASAIGIALLVIGASSVVIELQNDLNHIWRVPGAPHAGYTVLFRARLIAVGLILGFGFLLLVSLIINVALAALVEHSHLFTQRAVLLHALNLLFSLGAYSVLFAMLFKWLPHVSLAWGDVWRGAFVTALLLSLGQIGIGFYLGRSATTSAYAAAGSLLVLLLWLYYASQIFLFGAEFTGVYARQRRSAQRDRHSAPIHVPGVG
ncbi:MAG TPA: YihY/virulence factor BrkB family protein [Steroidobacteraceae bacterium]